MRLTMGLNAVGFEFQLRSVIVKVCFQDESVITTIVPVTTSSGDNCGKLLEVFRVKRLATLSKPFEDHKTRFAAIEKSRMTKYSRCNVIC